MRFCGIHLRVISQPLFMLWVQKLYFWNYSHISWVTFTHCITVTKKNRVRCSCKPKFNMAVIDLPVTHYDGVLMSTMASQITSLMIVYSIVYLSADQRKHQSSALLAFVRGIHRRAVNSPHKGPVTRKMFPFDDVIMCRSLDKPLMNCGGLVHEFTSPVRDIRAGACVTKVKGL